MYFLFDKFGYTDLTILANTLSIMALSCPCRVVSVGASSTKLFSDISVPEAVDIVLGLLTTIVVVLYQLLLDDFFPVTTSSGSMPLLDELSVAPLEEL